MRHMVKWGVHVLTLCMVAAGAARAQNPLGGLRGTVADRSGARIPSAIVSAKNSEKLLVREGQADQRGEFRLEDLPPGSYELTASAPGFTEAR